MPLPLTSLLKMLHGIPLTIKTLMVTLLVSGLSWSILDAWQSRLLQELFFNHQMQLVQEKGRENRALFNLLVNNHHQTIKLLAAQKNLSDYLDATTLMGNAPAESATLPEILFHAKPPSWLPKPSVLRTFIPLRYLLLGRDGQVREVYKGLPESPPTSLLRPNLLLRQLSHNQTFMTKVDGHPYLITSETVTDDFGHPRATLMLANPMNDIFLTTTQGITRQFAGIVALLEGEKATIIASTRPTELPQGTPLEQTSPHFVVTDRYLFDYGSSDMRLQLVTLVSTEEFNTLSRSILRTERQQRAINAMVLILFCLLIMLWVTRTIEKVTRKIVHFSEETLGLPPLEVQKKDELSILEEHFERSAIEIIRTRDELHTELMERTRAEEEIRKLSLAVEQGPAAVMITDPDGVIQYVNAQFSLLTGYTSTEASGRKPNLLKSGLTPDSVYQNLWQTILSGKTWHGELQNRRKGGETYWEKNTISAIRDSSGVITHFLSIKEDISLRMEMENALQHAKEAAEAAYQVKSDFLSNITHELRTPLSTTTGVVRLLLDGEFGDLNKAQKKQLNSVLDSGNQLTNLIDDLLNLSQVDTEQFYLDEQPFNLPELITQANNAITVHAREKGLALSCRIRPDTPIHVLGDPTRLRQALLHILRNAIKFTRQGLVTMVCGPDTDPNAKPNTVLFTIADTGIGIPQEKLETIFDPFTQVDSSSRREFGGTGLGLAIAKRVIDLMGGRIWAESRVNEGSTFFLSIPFPLALPPSLPLIQEGEPLPKGLRILVAGENAVNRLILKKLLANMEFEVTESTRCRSAWEALESARDKPFHLMFLDCSRSATGGTMEINEARQRLGCASMPIVLINLPAGGLDDDALQQQNLYYLTRPIQRVQVHDIIKKALLNVSRQRMEPLYSVPPSSTPPTEEDAPRLDFGA